MSSSRRRLRSSDCVRGCVRRHARRSLPTVFNDAQIASMKDRLELSEEQKSSWQAVEASLRELVWDRSHGVRPRLEPKSLERFKQAAAPFVATLSAKQQSVIQALADIVGLQLNR